MAYIYESYDVAVIGAGHAGCEAALACARLGLNTIMFTVSMDSIALMPCNPNIGGTSKGHLVREIDALGGEMGKNIDRTYIQSKMLNGSKGPAVHSLRAQADKLEYSSTMRAIVENTKGLTLKQAEVTEILTIADILETPDYKELMNYWKNITGISENEEKRNSIAAVKVLSGGIFPCKAAILCTGVYLKSRCIYGETSVFTGPNGLPAANFLTDSLLKHGIELLRFKTGTPARIDKRSIDFTKMEEQFGDEKVVPFSFTNQTKDITKDQVSCWLTYTNETTHQIIRDNLERSPLFSGDIKGTGPRYCPSIEDKVVRFSDKDRHQVFIEPEGNYTNEMYISGMSSSLPEDVQYQMYRSVPGLENANIVRNAYAIEYDCLNAMQLDPTLEFKKIKGLFSGGQMNGSSGYEEAAAQGLIAGVNAARKISGKAPLILTRSDAYIGVLIDDLVTKETHEPYRMMTSRAEYRLLLRQDNADLRLTRIGYDIGLIDEIRYKNLIKKEQMIDSEIKRLEMNPIGATKAVQNFLEKMGSTPLKTSLTLAELLKRPEMTYESMALIDANRELLPNDVIEQVEINIKYEGYIQRQFRQVEQSKRMESKRIPEDIDYHLIPSLRLEAKQKLAERRPISVGQASRISGVSPADISVLLIYIEQFRNK